MLREMKTRFGRHAGGFIWALVEPVMFIASLLLLKSAVFGSTIKDSNSAANLAAGILTFFLFRNILQRAMAAVSGNRGLLLYPIVTPLDILLARSLLETATSIVVTCLIVIGIFILWGEGVPAAPLSLLGVLTVAAGFGLSLGLLLGAATAVWPTTERFVAPLLRASFFISGVFFIPASLPPELRDLLLWNPILHITEAGRAAWLYAPIELYGSLIYPIAVAWLLLPLGLMSERLARSRIAPA
jgi:capsular polysaccharide transport system permease protein